MDAHSFWVVMIGFAPAFLGGLIAAMTAGHGDHAHYGRSAFIAAVGALTSFVLFNIPMEWGDVGMFQSEARQGLGWLPYWTSPIGWSMLATFVGALSPKIVGGIFATKLPGWLGTGLAYGALLIGAGFILASLDPLIAQAPTNGPVMGFMNLIGLAIGAAILIYAFKATFGGKKGGGGGHP